MGSEQKNAFLAIVLSAGILFGWQYFFAPKSPSGPIEPVKETTVSSTKSEVQPTPSGPIEPVNNIPAEEFKLASSKVGLSFKNNLSFTSFTHSQAAFPFSETVGSDSPLILEFDLGNGFKPYSFNKQGDNSFTDATGNLTLSTQINDNGSVRFSINSKVPFKYRFTLNSKNKRLENGQQRYFSVYSDELNQIDVGEEETKDTLVKWAGIDFNYHLFAFYLEKETNLLVKSTQASNLEVFSNKSEGNLTFNLVYLKKDYDFLVTLGNKLQGSVDFGMWGLFAVWILKGLQYFYTWFPNYGISILLLTLLVRLVTFPLQYKSIVSMKKLQLIQPELSKLREKFKDDPQRMQKESMELFKRSGANPLGGCLPLLLQMPVFFAFYKVLNHSVELVGSPFIWWIKDLSNKDPFYVLPVLMTIAMFLQQKLTPNTITDPVQKNMMLFMPLVFGFIMKDLPAGLSLYIFASTLLGILQQVFVFNAQKTSDPVVV